MKYISSLRVFAFLLLLTLNYSIAGAQTRSSLLDRLTDSYKYYYLRPGIAKLSEIENHCAGCVAQAPSEKKENDLCQSFYQKIAGDGVISIHVSFGYFDDSEGEEFRYLGESFGENASTEEAWYNLMRSAFLSRCSGNLRLCEFSEITSGHFVKDVTSPNGKTVRVDIVSDHASLTPYYKINVGSRAREQQERSEANRQAFLHALQHDDAVFYIGHSRNGGGPDFYPPHLRSNGKPDYRGYYMPKHPGLNDMMTAIQARGEAPPILGMYSCLSEAWFGAKLYAASPQSAYLFTQSDQLIGMQEHVMAAIAALDSLARFQCHEGMSEEIGAMAMESGVQELLRNVMSKRSQVDVHAIPQVVHAD